jgi:tetratricopeptide (TPR) repeat protein
MFRFTALFCLITAAAAAQTGDIYQRLRTALGPAGESAVSELSRKNFAAVARMLSSSGTSDDSSRAEIASLQGAVAFLAGDMKAALLYFDRAAQIKPLADADAFTRAMALVELKDDQQAHLALAALAQKYPRRALYIYWLGRLDYDQHRYEDAVQELSKAVELDPQSARAWDSLGLAFDMQGKVEEARDAFQKAVTLNRSEPKPSPWPAHDFGSLMLRANRLPEAEAALRESLHYDPNLAPAHYHLARTLEREGKDQDALSEYRLAVNRDPTSTDACYSLALLYRKLHRDQDAEAMFAEYKKRKQASAAQ